MNNTQIKLLRYLGEPQRSRRDDLFEDLAHLLSHQGVTDSFTKGEIRRYLEQNTRKFCDNGINRAAAQFNIILKPIYVVGMEVKEMYAHMLPNGSVICGATSQRSFMNSRGHYDPIAYWTGSDGETHHGMVRGTIVYIGAGE